MINKTACISAHISRTLLGIVFLFSGSVKAIDPLGTTYKIEDYLKAFGGFFTDLVPLAQTAAFVLIGLEFVLGVCLVLNIRPQWTSWLTLVFYAVMTPLTLYIAIMNPVSDCGCFGDAIILTNWQTFWKDVVLLCLVIFWLCTKKHASGRWIWQAELVISLIAAGMVTGFMIWTLHHLPVIDFRPFKTGNYLPALMEYPEDAEKDVYEVALVYEKDGQKQTFTLENYPKGDSTWTFVSQQSTLVKKGYEPPIHDFDILNAEDENITYDLLESEEPVTLVVMYDLAKTETNSLDRIAELPVENKYYVTGSGTDEILAFCLQHPQFDAEDFCTCDPVTLKTIVRANPGIVVIQNGTVQKKLNARDLE
ncbi:MAG: DoxX family protein [Paludibacteraceae bacterium]|nr:DoxX family protein [Paludibacteraceae bacterium]